MMERGFIQSFLTALKLGLLSFGGPTAHIGYFREEYVNRKKWLDDASFADLVALCQLLPGPASSQIGIGIGWMRGGWLGSIAAWLGFTLPSAIVMALFAYVYEAVPSAADAGWIKGLEFAAIAIVATAVLGMARALAPDKPRATIAMAAAAAVLLLPFSWTQIATMIAAAGIGLVLQRGAAAAPEAANPAARSNRAHKRIGFALLLLFGALLLLLPLACGLGALPPLLSLFESFYRSGALVFGGGHVVLPLLEREMVPAGWVSADQFLAGYAATQAMPGPLFTFAAFLGASAYGAAGAVIATVAVFLPGYLLVVGVLPFWQQLRRLQRVAYAVYGINAAVVGILFAALFDPLFTGAVANTVDFVLVAALYLLFTHWKLPPWALVLTAALAGLLVYGF
jgi:chromate transporter